MDYIKDLHELCETISEAIKDANEKIRSSGGKLSGSDAEYIDKLTHSLKSVKAVLKMIEDDDGYSGYYPNWGGSYRGSYARRRDSMGRYSGERGYSRSDLSDKLRDMMHDAPDDRTRDEIKRLADKIENA